MFAFVVLLIVALCHKGLVVADITCVGPNLIQNPSFESPVVPSNKYSEEYPFLGINGWRGFSSFAVGCGATVKLELHRPQYCPGWEPFDDGNNNIQWIELDSVCNILMVQEFPTEVGKEYLFSYYYSPRPSVDCEGPPLPASSNGMNVYVNYRPISRAPISKDGKIGEMQWQEFRHFITATGNKTSIQFLGIGTSEGCGAFLDLVSVCDFACSPAGPCHTVGRDANGKCFYQQVIDETPCIDGNECTIGDKCVAGECVGTPKSCGSGDQCHYDQICDYTTGECIEIVKPDGTECEADSNLCTVDQCICGVCTTTDNQCCVTSPQKICGKPEEQCQNNYLDVLDFFGLPDGGPSKVVDGGENLNHKRCCVPKDPVPGVTVVNGKCVYNP